MIGAALCAAPSFSHAQSSADQASASQPAGDPHGYVAKAVITAILSDTRADDGTTTPFNYNETVSARITSGSEQGKTIAFQNYYTDGDGQKLNVGEHIYVTRSVSDDSGNLVPVYQYSSIDHDRMPVVILFCILFLACIVWLGGKQGMRGLISLAGGICLIVFVFLPGVIHGDSPILLSIAVASFVATIGAYITHGFSRMTTSAILGMIITIVFAAFLSDFAVHAGYLSGITDENTSEMFSNPMPGQPPIDFQGLLLGGIIIGLLGVLYDAAIGQSVAVEELARAGPTLSRSAVYRRAFRMGREHIGALVNTLVLAYIGASLPTMLSIYESVTYFGKGYAWEPFVNMEFIATEIIRTSAGAVGLMLTIPITTFVAVHLLVSGSNRDHGDRVV